MQELNLCLNRQSRTPVPTKNILLDIFSIVQYNKIRNVVDVYWVISYYIITPWQLYGVSSNNLDNSDMFSLENLYLYDVVVVELATLSYGKNG